MWEKQWKKPENRRNMGRRRSKERKVIYYSDELNDEFSRAQITPRVVDQHFRYFHGGLWDICSLAVQSVLSMPVKYLYAKLKFHIRYVGREKLKSYKNSGYFMYGNHTQPFADTFIPSLGNYPKRNFFIVNPENISMPGLGTLVEMLGAIPIPCDLGGMKNFIRSVEDKIERKHSVTIYPEAHIWPYYIGIRPFKAVSFQYPVKLECPVFAVTNTYHRRGRKGEKVKLVTYIDGPFFADRTLNPKEARQKLRDQVYACMVERSKCSDQEYIEYRRREDT